MTHLAVSGLAVFAVEVGPVAVLVPPGSFVRQRAVGDGDVVVSVFRGEGSALVVAQGVTWEQGGAQQRARENTGILVDRRMSGAAAYGCDKLGSDEERQAAGGARQRILVEFFETREN